MTSRLLHSALLLAWIVPVLGDDLDVGSANGAPGENVLVPVDLLKSNPVVAVQMELKFPVSHVAVTPPTLVTATDHRADSNVSTPGIQSIVIHSPSNSELPADFQVQLSLDLQPNSPAGGPSVSLEDILFSDATGATFGATVDYTLVETWRRTHFTEVERGNPAIIGDDRDPDGDRIPNLLEAGGGTLPGVKDASGLAGGELEVAGDGKVYLKMRFRRTKDAGLLGAVQLEAQSSSDLVAWSGDDVIETVTGQEDATSREVEATVEIGPAPMAERKFLRVEARRITSDP